MPADLSDLLTEPLKSLTLIKIPHTPKTSSEPNDNNEEPFHLCCSQNMDYAFCCASNDGQAVVFPEGGAPHSVDLLVSRSEVISIELAQESKMFICAASPSGGSIRTVQLTNRTDSTTTAKGQEILCGGIGRGFADGSREVALLHTPTLCAVYADPETRQASVLAFVDRGNYAIRLVNLRPEMPMSGIPTQQKRGRSTSAGPRQPDTFGCVRTVCGCGIPGYNDGAASESLLREITGLLWTSDGDLICSDGPNHAIRLLRRQFTSDVLFHDTFVIGTLIGGHAKRSGDTDGPLEAALCCNPAGICAGPAPGTFLIADAGNNAVRLVDLHNRSVATVASTADYEAGSPVPQGLVAVSQVTLLTLRGQTSKTGGLAVLCTSRAQRSVSMIVSTSLPFPPRRHDAAGVVSVGRMYDQGPRAMLGTIPTDLPVRRIVMAAHAGLRKVPQDGGHAFRSSAQNVYLGDAIADPTRAKKSVAYLDIEMARHRRDEESMKRATRSRSQSMDKPSRSSNSPSRNIVGGGGLDHHDEKQVVEAPALKNLRLLFEAHASSARCTTNARSTSPEASHLPQQGEETLFLRKMHFWNFCVTAGLTSPITTAPSTTQQSQYDLLDTLYAKSLKHTGYKTTSRMDFATFTDTVARLTPGWSVLPADEAADDKIKRVESVVQRYCVNAQSAHWEAKQILLDILTANEVAIRKIFDAYANETSRQHHVGRIPFLRFQSLFHTLHIYPSLISQSKLKELFDDSLRTTVFSKEGASTSPMRDSKSARDCNGWKTGSLNLFQFIEGLVRMAWHCFSSNGKSARAPEMLPIRLSEAGISGGESVLAAVELLFRWINVEIETMEPSTEVATRHRMTNNEACAVFPPKVPLLECRAGKSCSSRSVSYVASTHAGHALASIEGGSNTSSPRQLERELRRLRRQQDSVDFTESRGVPRPASS